MDEFVHGVSSNVHPIGVQIVDRLTQWLHEHYTDKNNKKLVQMSCTAYIVYTLHLSLHHANFGQFKAKQVLLTAFLWRILFWIFFIFQQEGVCTQFLSVTIFHYILSVKNPSLLMQQIFVLKWLKIDSILSNFDWLDDISSGITVSI